jgi:lysophospholipase L1-like esterase
MLSLLVLVAPARAQTPQDATTPAPTSTGGLLVKAGQKVVFMGDSITDGGWGESGGYIHLVVTALATLGVKIEPVPAGVGGNKSDDMLARLDRDALSKKPDWLLLSCGVNDVWSRKIDLDTFKKNITSIVDQAQAAGIKVMILTPTPIYELKHTEFSRLSDYVAFMVQLTQDRKLPLADENAAYFAYLKTQPPDPHNNVLTVDGVHPNPDGHQLLAQTILQAFGVAPDRMPGIRQAWLALPGGANLPIGFGFREETEVTPAQNAALQQMAADKKISMIALVRGFYMASIRDALVARGNLDGYNQDDLMREAVPLFEGRIAKLASSGTPTSGTVPPAADPNEKEFSTVSLPNGDVKLSIQFGFRGTASLNLPQYEKLKQIALERKLTPHLLTLDLFMEAIRDTLVAHGDVSAVHQDTISHDSWPLYQKNVDETVK